jgi:hypothetical protein
LAQAGLPAKREAMNLGVNSIFKWLFLILDTAGEFAEAL